MCSVVSSLKIVKDSIFRKCYNDPVIWHTYEEYSHKYTTLAFKKEKQNLQAKYTELVIYMKMDVGKE